MAAAGTAGMSDEESAGPVPRRNALHGGAPGGLERQGPPPGHGPGRHRPRGAVPHDAARDPEHAATSTSPKPRPGLQRLVLRPHAGGRGPALRRRRGAADARRRRRRGGGRRDPSRRRACRAWCRCSCGRTRPSTGGRSTTRSTTRSGRRRSRHRAPDRAPPVPRARPPRRLRGPAARAAPPTPTATYDVDSTSWRARTHERGDRAPASVHPGDRQPGRRDEHRSPT